MANVRRMYVALVTVLLIVAGFAIVVWSGVYNVAADEPHTRLVSSVMAVVRERSVKAGARGLQVPDLNSPQMIASGARQYAEMCADCHLAPGMRDSEIRPGLNPQPPDLIRHPMHDAAEAFWIVKHGIKMTGMPAWGMSHDDQTLWSIVAFLNRMPQMSAAQYQQLTAGASERSDAGHKQHHDAGAPHQAGKGGE